MFLVRSAFWLGLAFVVLQPHTWANADSQATEMGTRAIDMGREIATRQIENIECNTLECAGGKALLLATGMKNNPSQAFTMHDSPSLAPAPVPRPRLARAG